MSDEAYQWNETGRRAEVASALRGVHRRIGCASRMRLEQQFQHVKYRLGEQ
jgi:hypothetical protein